MRNDWFCRSGHERPRLRIAFACFPGASFLSALAECRYPALTEKVTVGLAVTIAAVCQYFYPSDTSSPKETTKWVRPSPWLAELMGLCTWLLMTVLPASLVSRDPVPSPCRASPWAGLFKHMTLRSTIRYASPIDSRFFRANYQLHLPPQAHTYQ